MPVHQMGLPCDMAAILAVADRHGLPVVEDAACAIGSEIRIGGKWERIGRPHGTVACFSFHPRKIVTTGDGGMLTTSDPELDAQVPPAPAARDERPRHGPARRQVGDLRGVPGGRVQLPDDRHPGRGRARCSSRRLPGILARRVELAERYTQALADIPGLVPPHVPEYARPNYQAYPVRVTPDYPLSRDELMQAAARPRDQHAPRDHERSPGGGVRDRRAGPCRTRRRPATR